MAVPGAPTEVAASIAGDRVRVSWVAPASGTQTYYAVAPLPSGVTAYPAGDTTYVDLPELPRGATRACRVAPGNAGGVAAFASSGSVTVPFARLVVPADREFVRAQTNGAPG